MSADGCVAEVAAIQRIAAGSPAGNPRRDDIDRIAAEIRGEIRNPSRRRTFILSARADRIEHRATALRDPRLQTANADGSRCGGLSPN